jgi:hypothetical protein
MKTVTLALLLLASCQVHENRPAPGSVATTVQDHKAVTEPNNSSNINLPGIKKPALEENTVSSKPKTKRVVPGKSPSSTPNIIESPIVHSEKTDAIETDPSAESSGGANYEEGYIPFIKQYW